VRTRQSCTFALVEGAESAEDAARETRETVEAHKHLELMASTAMDFPIGEAVRVSYRYRTMPDEDRFILHETYVTGPEGVVSVYCAADDPPADHWQSVVESMERVGPEGPVSAPFDPRVEVPDHGFAVDFGADWLVRPWGGPGPVLGGMAGHDALPSEVSMIVLRAVTAEGVPTDAECMIEDAKGVLGLPKTASSTEWQAAFLASAEGQQQKTSIPDVATVDLASGRAVRADWERWRGTPATAWVIIGGEHRLVLFCRADQPPADDWRSIAETFEVLRGAE
jgi:hypothetical protein